MSSRTWRMSMCGALLLACSGATSLEIDAAEPVDAAVAAPDAAVPDVPNYAFITSTTVPTDFGANASGALATADAICNELGQHLRPGAYVAWLSTHDVDAATRIPLSARGWIRPDGLPFADTRSDLLLGRLYHPLVIDENGASVPDSGLHVLTDTRPNGTTWGHGDCEDWTVHGGTAVQVFGLPHATTVEWTQAAVVSCVADPILGSGAFYCLGIDHHAAVAAPVPPAPHRLAFLSAAPFSPGSGTASADDLCQREGVVVRPASQFRALVATTAESAAARFDASPGSPPWARPDGVLLAASAQDTFAGPFLAPISVTLARTDLSVLVWLGAADFDTAASDYGCSDWAAHDGSDAMVTSSTHDAAYFVNRTCDAMDVHLFCLER